MRSGCRRSATFSIATAAGFLLTMGSIQLIPLVVDRIGWTWAFAVLAVGPALGIESIRRLKRDV